MEDAEQECEEEEIHTVAPVIDILPTVIPPPITKIPYNVHGLYTSKS